MLIILSKIYTKRNESNRIKSNRRKQLPQRRHDDVFVEESQVKEYVTYMYIGTIALISGSH